MVADITNGRYHKIVPQGQTSFIRRKQVSILLPQARAKRQSFEFRTKGRPTERLLGDKLRLNQILINLLSNAIKYTQEGGMITCTVEELPRTSPQFSNLRFVVADNGMGMSEEFVKIVFEPFAREASSTVSGIQGTGLGMAITKNLVELMGGIITVASRQSEGSVFTVELSFALPEHDEEENLWKNCGISRVLVVDVRNALDAGMNGHLAKPIDMDAVKILLGRLRRGKEP